VVSENQVNKILSNFKNGKEVESLLAAINCFDIVNSWVDESEPFPSEDTYYSLMSVSDFFHVDEDLLDYHDRDYFQQNTDWHKLWTLSDMASKIDSHECTSIYHLERDGLIISVEANLHGQNGLYFDNLRLFQSLENLYSYYKENGNFIFRDKTFYSHDEQELQSLFEAYIQPFLKDNDS
tara:strand:- start:812 stop:1351 length:540 start_codon:yes stop_codon:yes gene_type:complete